MLSVSLCFLKVSCGAPSNEDNLHKQQNVADLFFLKIPMYRKMAVNTGAHYSYALVSGWHSRSFSLVTHTPRGAVQIPYGVW